MAAISRLYTLVINSMENPVISQVFSNLPLLQPCEKVLVVLSGGLDSTTALVLAHYQYGSDNVQALTFDYGQRQRHEIICAGLTCRDLGIEHMILEIPFLNTISIGFSANTDRSLKMPKVKDILGLAVPPTYVPNRNMILMSIAAAYAEVQKISYIFTGFESNDIYGYHDTTPKFVGLMNDIMCQNRTHLIQFSSPFCHLTKKEEIETLISIDRLSMLKNTLTCYDPKGWFHDRPCGVCPSCSERRKAFQSVGVDDPAL